MENMEEGERYKLSRIESRACNAPLLLAALADDWKSAKAFIEKNPDCVRAAITEEQGTALHSAAAAKNTRFVKEIVKLMKPEDLELQDKEACTALYFAAQSGIVAIAEEMVKKNKKLPAIPKDDIDRLPLYAAVKTGNRDMVSYLYSVTPLGTQEDMNSKDRIEILIAAISTELYDTALKIVDHTLKLAPEETGLLWNPLEMLARKRPSEIGNKSQPSLWERCLNSCFRGRFCNKAMMQASAHQLVYRLLKQFKDDNFSSTAVPHHMKLLVEATKVGNVEFLIILISSYPYLIWQVDQEEYGTLFHVAIKHRQEGAFSLIYEIGVLKGNLASFYAKEGNNMLLLAGELPSSDRLNIVSGAALQMQRELLWFQEIEKIVPKSNMNKPNTEDETPRDIFVKTHEELQKNGEKWMKDTANTGMRVAALIATVVFTAVFTVSGGKNQEIGIPIFLESNWFMVFFVPDTIAMLFSSTSILVFLSILESRSHTEKDFLISIPRRLALGLATLLISTAGMLIASTAACFFEFKSKTSFPIRKIVAAPAIPISLFIIIHYGLWFDIFRSAFYSHRSFLFRSQNRLLKLASQLGKE